MFCQKTLLFVAHLGDWLVAQKLLSGNYWYLAQLLVINCWLFGICGLGINDGFVGFRCFMGFGAAQAMLYFVP